MVVLKSFKTKTDYYNKVIVFARAKSLSEKYLVVSTKFRLPKKVCFKTLPNA